MLSSEDFQKILSFIEESADVLNLPPLGHCTRKDEEQEEIASKLDDQELRRRVRDANQNPPAGRWISAYYYARDPNVAAYIKRTAKGICDLCRNPAPFNKWGEIPYLECHHITMLAEGGTDTVDNTVALCPNCHRRVHILKLADDNKRLRQRIAERDS